MGLGAPDLARIRDGGAGRAARACVRDGDLHGGPGDATATVDDRSLELAPGDVLVVEPGEARAIVRASSDLMLFVIHVPGEDGDLGADKTIVQPDRLDP